MHYISRNLETALIRSLKTRPLTYLAGGRQVGKSTLCAHLPSEIPVTRFTFDSPFLLSAARSDPAAFIAGLPKEGLVLIDEVQFAPEIFPYLKMKVDENRLEGRNRGLFLLTGSASLTALPALSEALVGRMSILTLWPLSASEFYQSRENLMEKLFSGDLSARTLPSCDIAEAISQATYPEIASDSEISRAEWFDSYLTTILARDIRPHFDLKRPETMTALLSVLAMRAGGLLNSTAISKETGLDFRTVDKMLAFATSTFLTFKVKPWAMPNSLGKRFVKSPKLYFTDSCFLTYVMKRRLSDIIAADRMAFGHVFENFVAAELMKAAAANRVELSHFRTQSGVEADFVLENEAGDVVGIEVKSSGSVQKKALGGLAELKALTGERFKKGLVLYAGTDIVPLGDRMWAVPASILWS